jgi:CheY-like chemotaxis protein
MTSSGRILLADDEESFLLSTAKLLQKAGYECDSADDAMSAAQMLCENEYDVLISDIRMPGNENLDLIRQVPRMAKGLSVILITGFPSIETAIPSVGLNVTAYLTKPMSLDELLERVRVAVRRSKVFQRVYRAEQHLQQSSAELAHLKEILEGCREDALVDVERAFLALTYQNISSSLMDACNIWTVTDVDSEARQICHMLECPRLAALTDAIRETIDMLRKTQHAFKSKDLRRLREKLQELVREDRKGLE